MKKNKIAIIALTILLVANVTLLPTINNKQSGIFTNLSASDPDPWKHS